MFLQYQILGLFLNPWEIFCFSCLHLYGRWNQRLLVLLMAHCSLGLREHFRVEILWLESLSPAETNPFSEAAVKTNFRAFLKCHFFSYCRNVSSVLFCLSQSQCQPIDSKSSSSNILTLDCRNSQVSLPILFCCCWVFLCVATSSPPQMGDWRFWLGCGCPQK